MKRSLAVLLLLLALTPRASANLLINPGFDWGGGWTNSLRATYEWWASRSVVSGLVFNTWLGAPATGEVYQDVPVTSGTYTFAGWMKREIHVNTTGIWMRIQWYDGSGVELQPATMADISSLPNDGLWHHVYVSGTCSSSQLARIRVATAAGWGAPGGGSTSLILEDTDLYAGPYVGGRLSNGSFENGGNEWRNASWTGNTNLWGGETGGKLGEWWAAHSGSNGLALYCWTNTGPRWLTITQPVVPFLGTGVYTFAMWIERESLTLLSNVQMKVEWYDASFSNKVQADSIISNIDVSTDSEWHEYYLSAVVTSPAFHEARASLHFEWDYNGDGAERSVKIDDVRFVSGPYTSAVVRDWAYHSAPGYGSSVEQVPGTNVGVFLSVNYGTTSATFYVLGNNPSAALYPEESGRWELRTAWYDSVVTNRGADSNGWVAQWGGLTKIGSITLGTNTVQFHGLPATESKIVDLWRYNWTLPLDTNGVPYTNRISIYYAPFFKSTNGIQQTDYMYLSPVSTNDVTTNNLGQRIATNYMNRDYSFDVNPSINASLVNGDFEVPGSTNGLANSGWGSWGGANRDWWALRSGGWGGYFASWGAGEAGIWQDVICETNTYTFSIWVRQELGALPTNTEIELEWYTSLGHMIQVDTKKVSTALSDDRWHRVFITATCTNPSLYFVRPLLGSQYNAGTGDRTTIQFDDAELYAGAFTGRQELVNTGFEIGTPGFLGSRWDPAPWSLAEMAWWAEHFAGTNGAAFKGWSNGTAGATISQSLNMPTGTFVFSVWMLRETSFTLTNAEVRIEWYDSTLTNKVQADSVTNVTLDLLADTAWHQFAVTGTCLNANLFEVRPTVFAQWVVFDDGLKVDDASLTYTNIGSGYTDGIPDWWWDKYGVPAGQRQQTNFSDGDPVNNGDEYAADTDPTNASHFFDNIITNVVSNNLGRGVMRIVVGPPTTNSRLYEAWWKTNLMEVVPWAPYGLYVPGADLGGPVILVVTNDPGERFYRTGVKLP